MTWSNEGKVNSARPGMTYSKELQQKMKMLDKLVWKNIRIKQFWWNPVSWLYLGTAIVFWWILRGVSPRKESRKCWKIFQFNRSRFIKFFLYNIHSKRNKTHAINSLMKKEIHAATVLTALSWPPWKQTCSYVKKCKFTDESWQPWIFLGDSDLIRTTWNRKITWQF